MYRIETINKCIKLWMAKEGNGLQLQKVGPTFSSCIDRYMCLTKIYLKPVTVRSPTVMTKSRPLSPLNIEKNLQFLTGTESIIFRSIRSSIGCSTTELKRDRPLHLPPFPLSRVIYSVAIIIIVITLKMDPTIRGNMFPVSRGPPLITMTKKSLCFPGF